MDQKEIEQKLSTRVADIFLSDDEDKGLAPPVIAVTYNLIPDHIYGHKIYLEKGDHERYLKDNEALQEGVDRVTEDFARILYTNGEIYHFLEGV